MHSLAQLKIKIKVMGCQVKGRGWGRKPLHTIGGQGRQGRPCSHCGWESRLTAWPWGLDVTDDSALTLQTRAWDMCRMCAPGQKHKSAHSRLVVIAHCSNSLGDHHRHWDPTEGSHQEGNVRNQGWLTVVSERNETKWASLGWIPSRCSNSRMGKTIFENVYRINETIQKSKKWIPWKSI